MVREDTCEECGSDLSEDGICSICDSASEEKEKSEEDSLEEEK